MSKATSYLIAPNLYDGLIKYVSRGMDSDKLDDLVDRKAMDQFGALQEAG